MEDNNYHIFVCPSCRFKYRAPESFHGKSLSCKNCGARFKLDFKNKDRRQEIPRHSPDAPGGIEEISRKEHGLVIGKLAVRHRLATKEQIRKALIIQKQKKREGRELPLGKILLRQGIINPGQLQFLVSLQGLMRTQKSDLRFGMIAVKNEFTSQGPIDQALLEQQRIFRETGSSVPIGDLLVKSGALTGQQRDAILTRQEGLQAAPETSEGEKEEIRDIDLTLRVSDNKLTAHLLPPKGGLSGVTIASLKAFIQSKGIVFGIADDARIIEYLKAPAAPFKIAEGKPPEPFDKTDIQYFFDTDPLNIGKIREGDHIDFKDRGPIPQVNENDLLAEKIRTRKDHDGMDVFGRSIFAPKTAEPRLRCGKGVRISDDGLKIFAAARGRPELSPDGKVSVHAELKIQGDVDLKTGHIDFEGVVVVSGTVQSGFHVNCGSLSAKEILHATLETTGNVLVREGIIGADIRAGGSVKARHIRESKVAALGEVVVEKEILDTRLETSGSIATRKGSILSSHITAKKGIQAHQIGSEKSNPCTLIVGVDIQFKNEIKTLKQEISSKEKEMEDLRKLLGSLQEESKKVQVDLGNMAQEQDRAMVQARHLKEKRADFEVKGQRDLIAQIETTLEDIEKKSAERENHLENIFKEQDRIEEAIAELQEKIASCENAIRKIEQDISELIAWSQSEKGVPEVKVPGTIFPFTLVKGRYASLRLPEKHRNILLREVTTRDEKNRPRSKIRLTRP